MRSRTLVFLKSDFVFTLGVSALFVGIAGFAAFHHEMWRDELQHWLLVLESPSLGSLFGNLRNEGHPPLWHLLLFFFQKLWRELEVMQLSQLALGALTAFLFCWWAPFTRFQRAGFALGYFTLYEYTVIPRNYLIGVFFLLLAAHFYERRHERPVRLALALGLASLTSFFGLILAGGLGVAWLLSVVAERRLDWKRLALPFALLALAFALSVESTRPKDALTVASTWRMDFHLKPILTLVAKTFFYVPSFRSNWWNHHLLETWKLTEYAILAPLSWWLYVKIVGALAGHGLAGRDLAKGLLRPLAAFFLLTSVACFGFFHFKPSSPCVHLAGLRALCLAHEDGLP